MKKIITIQLIFLLIFLGISQLSGQEVKTKFSGEVFSITTSYEGEISFLKTDGDTLLNESFEGEVTGWSYIDNDADGNAWGVYVEEAPGDTVAHTGIRGVGVFYNSSGNDDWLITPQLELTAGATVTFSFWAHSHSSSYLEDFNVKLSTNSTNIADFTVTLEEVRSVPYEWTQYTYDLSAYAGQSIYLAVQCVSVDKWYLWADDFVLTATGGGPSLNADFIEDVTSGTAPLAVNFTDQSTGSPTSWEWDFDNDGTVDATVQNPEYTFQNAGTYTVSLTVSDGTSSDTETKTDYIIVHEPSGDFTVLNTGPHDIRLDDFSLVQDGSGNLHTVFIEDIDDEHRKLYYASSTNNGTSWSIENIPTIYGAPYAAKITVDQDGKVFIVYIDTDYSISGSRHRHDLYATHNRGSNWSRTLLKAAWNFSSGYGYVQYYWPMDIVVDKDNVIHVYARQEGWYRYGGDVYEYTYSTSWSDSVDTEVGGGLSADDVNADWFHINIKSNGNYYAVWGDGFRKYGADSSYIKYGIRDASSQTGPFSQYTGRSDGNRLVRSVLDGSDVVFALYNKRITDDDFTTLYITENWGDPIEIASVSSEERIYPAGMTVDANNIIYALWNYNDGNEWIGSYWTQKTLDGWETPSILPDASFAAVIRKTCYKTPDAFMYLYVDYSDSLNKKLMFGGISVTPTLVADFSADPTSGTVPLTVNFTDQSTGSPTSWEWDFDNDGTVDATEQNPTHTYTEPVTFTVSLTVSDDTNSDTMTKENYIVVEEFSPVELNLISYKVSPVEDNAYINFGYSHGVDISGDYAIGGAYSDDVTFESSGSAYTFHWNGNTWVQQAKLNASDAEKDDWFGMSVAIDGNIAIVGAPGKSYGATTPGSAYIYTRLGEIWSQTAILNPSDGVNEDRFGVVVELKGNVAVVSADKNDGNGYDCGAVYVFRFDGSTWNEEAKISPDDLANYAYFGYDVDILENYILIGAVDDGPGKAYLSKYDGTSWNQVYKFVSSDGQSYDSFGWSVTMNENTAAISAIGNTEKFYIFNKVSDTEWIESQIIYSGIAEDTYFARALAITNDYLICGAEENDSLSYNAGLAYLYHNDGTSWTLYDKLAGDDLGFGTYFGKSIAADNYRFIVGAPGAYNDSDIKTGASYVFMEVEPVEIINNHDIIPTDFALCQNYPNPFNPTTTIVFDIPQAAKTNITVYDITGRLIDNLVSEYKQPGKYSVVWNAGDIPSGMYFVRMKAGNFSSVKKMMLLK